MRWNEFLSWRCAQPSRVGRFLHSMADAYLCAMPMNQRLLTETPFSDSHQIGQFNATTPYTIYYYQTISNASNSSITIAGTQLSIYMDSVSSSGSSYFNVRLLVVFGGDPIYGTSYKSQSIRPGNTTTVTTGPLSYEGSLIGNQIKLGVEVTAPYTCQFDISGVLSWTGFSYN